MIRAVRILLLSTRLLYLRAVLWRVPVAHPYWTTVFREVMAARERLDAAWEA